MKPHASLLITCSKTKHWDEQIEFNLKALVVKKLLSIPLLANTLLQGQLSHLVCHWFGSYSRALGKNQAQNQENQYCAPMWGLSITTAEAAKSLGQ